MRRCHSLDLMKILQIIGSQDRLLLVKKKENDYLVDNVALIEKEELLKYGEFITMNVEIF